MLIVQIAFIVKIFHKVCLKYFIEETTTEFEINAI